jgi:hypothetical protein
MQDSPQTTDVCEALDELLEAHLRNLSEKLQSPERIEDIGAELATLNDLVYSYKRRDELLEKLLDCTTAEDKRSQIRVTLQAQHIRVVENRAELERIHARSHELLERSTSLIGRAQQQINERAHKYAGYALEQCALCKGVGGSAGDPCLACNGKGNVLVHQPSLKCPRCAGDGKPHGRESLLYSAKLCVVCRGTGWVMTADE